MKTIAKLLHCLQRSQALLIVGIVYLVSASSISAQVRIEDQFNGPFDKLGIKGIGSIVSVILANAFVVAGVLLLIFILLGGFKMIASAGSSDQQKAAQSKMAVTWAVLGFLIIFASYWIIQLVELITGIDIL